MAALVNIVENLKLWPAGKKTAALALVVVSIAGLVMLISWLQKADYQVLYSNLSEDDAGRITQELRDKRIPYQLGGGGTVLVSADSVYDLRLDLAAQGLPQGGGVGFEIFDNTSFTTSEFVQRLNYRRALEGELARTIRSLAAVQQCRVHLVTPDKSAFAFQQDRPESSAAVFVSLKKGRKLNNQEVEGIVHLVSSSVEDLSPSEITIVDDRGELLTKPREDSVASLSGSQVEYQENYEKNLSSKIAGILEPVVGRGKIKARVSASFDFTRSERTEEIFDPEGVVVRSEQKSTEKTLSGLSSAGIPGVASNLPGGSSSQFAPSQGQSQKQDEMINYETSKTITRVIESPVSLDRLTVAILIDGILQSEEGTEQKESDYAVRSEADVQYYEDMVKKTIGFDEERGDELSVTVMPFAEVQAEEALEEERNYLPMILTGLKYVVSIIISLLFFMIVLRPLIKSLSSPPARSAPGGVSVRTESGEDVSLSSRQIPLEKQVIEWANKNPQEAAVLVKDWLEEG